MSVEIKHCRRMTWHPPHGWRGYGLWSGHKRTFMCTGEIKIEGGHRGRR